LIYESTKAARQTHIREEGSVKRSPRQEKSTNKVTNDAISEARVTMAKAVQLIEESHDIKPNQTL